ncbi:hypothetical protein RI844_18095 [Thalassotalea fonticola]|uniref:Uncharacterized protein n=1 Tax=Thalassotalea fonticola TaxID=3065649 RepID=A0ABZ0GNT9_9GAMM|nr:hypothetical protein RI844_18095 [Colwelliaceae bacterium S1-1]
MTLFKQLSDLNPNKYVSVIYFICLLGLLGTVYILLLSGLPEGVTIIENFKMKVKDGYDDTFHRLFFLVFLYIVAFIGLLKVETTSKYNAILIGYLWLITLPSIINLKLFVLIPPLYATYVYYQSRMLINKKSNK